MKKKLIVLGLASVFSTALFANSCSGLYAGKVIHLRNTGLLGSTIEAIITGVDKDSEMVTIKLTHNGEYREGSCSFLKEEMR